MKKRTPVLKNVEITLFTYESKILFNKLTVNNKEGRRGRLGVGVGRRVYSILEDKDIVLKIEKNNRSVHDNLIEWFIYENYPHLHKWLARPIAKSVCNKYMLMQRGVVLSDKKDIPTNFPSGFGDTGKIKNWIKLNDGSVVMCDYSERSFIVNYVKDKIDYSKEPSNEW